MPSIDMPLEQMRPRLDRRQADRPDEKRCHQQDGSDVGEVPVSALLKVGGRGHRHAYHPSGQLSPLLRRPRKWTINQAPDNHESEDRRRSNAESSVSSLNARAGVFEHL